MCFFGLHLHETKVVLGRTEQFMSRSCPSWEQRHSHDLQPGTGMQVQKYRHGQSASETWRTILCFQNSSVEMSWFMGRRWGSIHLASDIYSIHLTLWILFFFFSRKTGTSMLTFLLQLKCLTSELYLITNFLFLSNTSKENRDDNSEVEAFTAMCKVGRQGSTYGTRMC